MTDESAPSPAETEDVPDAAPGRARRMGRAVGRVSSRLANGIPTGFVAALAVVVLIAILFMVASREEVKSRGYAEVTLFPDRCIVDPARQLNAELCQILGPGSYRVSFTKSLVGSTVVATRGSCCAGRIAASVTSERFVVVAIGRPGATEQKPVRVSIVVP